MRTLAPSFAAALLVATLASTGAVAAEPAVAPAGLADQVVVRYKAGTTAAERRSVASDHGLRVLRTSPNGRMQIVVADGRSTATTRRRLAIDPAVAAVANNSWRELDDDPAHEQYFDELWGIHNLGQTVYSTTGTADVDIDGLEALRAQPGSPDVVVAIIDDGIEDELGDLNGEPYWTNLGETVPSDRANNGIDDDGNGYVDDTSGWNWCTNTKYNQPASADDGHGTHLAGTIAAKQDGYGVVGVAAGVKVMSLKAFEGGTSCQLGGDFALAEAIDYAASFGVRIINASWGGSQPSDVIDAAIADSNALFVTAAGNDGMNIDVAGQGRYPAASTEPNVLTVTATDQRGRLPTFANYGPTSVDIAAPGVNILSTWATDSGACPCYAWSSGTSMAVPHVAGIAALVLSSSSNVLTVAELKARVLGAGVPLASMSGKTVTGDLANALRALDNTGPVAAPIDRHGINVGSIVGSTISTTMTWPAATDALSGVKSYLIKRSLNGAPWTTLTSSTTARSYKRTMSFGTPTRFQLYARDGAGNLGKGATGPTVTATLLQDGTAIAKYTGSWSTVNLSSASGGRLHRSSQHGATVTFTTSARAIAVVGRRGALNGRAKVYVDGVYKSTIDLRASSSKYKVVVFNTSWTSTATHSVKLVVIGGTGRVEVDAFVFLR